jgi:hypothetical protein
MPSAADDALPDLCPYCGEAVGATPDASVTNDDATPAVGEVTDARRCRACLAFLDPLSRHVTQGHMGPWYLRDATRPFYPGVAWEVLAGLLARGEISGETVLRGPTTGQFWLRAAKAPGIAHRLGVCHACGGRAEATEQACRTCGASFAISASIRTERDRLGLVPAGAERISAFASNEELGIAGPAGPRSEPGSGPPGGARLPQRVATSAEEEEASAIRLSLEHQVASERQKTRWLVVLVGVLLVMDVVLAVALLVVRTR